MKKTFIVLSLLSIMLTGCCISHNWQEATCTEPKTCTKCGETEGEPLGHVWQEATCSTPKTCTVCGETSGTTLQHTPSEWIVDTAATCSAEGSQHSTCAICGATITEPIPKLDHRPGEWSVTKAATALENGQRQQLCTVCGTVLNTETYELTATEKETSYKNMCQSYTFEEIARNPDSYKGNYAVFTGEVIQSMESGDDYTLRVSITKEEYDWYSDPILVTYTKKSPSESRILEDDIVTMYGQLNGTYTYESVLGNDVTLPLLNAEYIVIN